MKTEKGQRAWYHSQYLHCYKIIGAQHGAVQPCYHKPLLGQHLSPLLPSSDSDSLCSLKYLCSLCEANWGNRLPEVLLLLLPACVSYK